MNLSYLKSFFHSNATRLHHAMETIKNTLHNSKTLKLSRFLHYGIDDAAANLQVVSFIQTGF